MSWECGDCGRKLRDAEIRCPFCDAKEIATLRRVLEKTLGAYIEAHEHIKNDLQPEFLKIADGEPLSWPWSPPYDQAQAATRLATWYHGAWSDDLIAEARKALACWERKP